MSLILLRKFLVLGLVSGGIFASASDDGIILGVLEDVPGVYNGEANTRAIRVVFHKTEGDWQAYPSACENEECLKSLTSKYPAQVTWTVTLDGRNLGHLASRAHDSHFYSRIGLEEIAERLSSSYRG
jgi:hypothetical protein